jgi:hypothetical protein
MANGSTAHENIGTVRNVCSGLEVSPSHHSATSPIAHGGSRAVGHGSSTKSTGTLARKGKNHTRGNPRGTKTHIGKKNMHFQKSTGR